MQSRSLVECNIILCARVLSYRPASEGERLGKAHVDALQTSIRRSAATANVHRKTQSLTVPTIRAANREYNARTSRAVAVGEASELRPQEKLRESRVRRVTRNQLRPAPEEFRGGFARAGVRGEATSTSERSLRGEKADSRTPGGARSASTNDIE